MSVRAAAQLGKRHGYTLVYCESHGVNCFFVDNTVLRESVVASVPAGGASPAGSSGVGSGSGGGDVGGDVTAKLTVEQLYRPPNYFGLKVPVAPAPSSEPQHKPQDWVTVQ